MRLPLVIAHRGASGERAENTEAAFERAIELGADMIETDLHRTRDGVIVLHHDAELERLGASGEIRDYTAAELGALDAAPGRPERASIPMLLDVLERQAPRIDFNLELKVATSGRYAGMEHQVVAALEERNLLSRMLLSSFDDEVLWALRAVSESARIAVLASAFSPGDLIARAERVAAEAINPHRSLVTPELVARAHERSLAVYPYTANTEAEMERLLECGVDGVITNHPDRLRALLAQRP